MMVQTVHPRPRTLTKRYSRDRKGKQREATDRTTTLPGPPQDAQNQRPKRAQHLPGKGQQPKAGSKDDTGTRREPHVSWESVGVGVGGSHTSPWEAEAGKSQIQNQPGLYSEVLLKNQSPYLLSKCSQERKDMTGPGRHAQLSIKWSGMNRQTLGERGVGSLGHRKDAAGILSKTVVLECLALREDGVTKERPCARRRGRY